MDHSAWERICRPEDYFHADYVDALEDAGLDCSFRYFVAESDGETIGVTLAYMFQFPIALGIHASVLIAGSPVDTGFPFAIAAGDRNDEVLRLLLEAEVAEARRSGAAYLVVRDISGDTVDDWVEPTLTARGFHRVPLFNESVMDIRWPTFEEYLSALHGTYRKNVRRDLRKVYEKGAYTLEIAHGSAIRRYAEELRVLFDEVYERHPEDRDQIRLPLGYFAHVGSLDDSIVLLLRRDGALAGFDLLMARGGILDSTFCGQDYDLTAKDPVDRALTHEIVRYAIENGFRSLNFGIANDAIKARVGCRFRELYGYLLPLGVHRYVWPLGKRVMLRGYGFETESANMPKHAVFQDQ